MDDSIPQWVQTESARRGCFASVTRSDADATFALIPNTAQASIRTTVFSRPSYDANPESCWRALLAAHEQLFCLR
jgi:hypothetical protein